MTLRIFANKKILAVGYFCIVGILALSIYFGLRVSDLAKSEMVKSFALAQASEVQGVVGHHIEPEQMTEPIFGEDYRELKRHIEEVTAGSDLVELRIWDAGGTTILFSTDPTEIGHRAAATAERRRTIRHDEPHFSFVDVDRVDERSRFNRLLEVHVPLSMDGERAGVYELYLRTDRIEAPFQRLTVIIVVVIAAIIVSMLFIGLAALSLARRNDELTALSVRLGREADTDGVTGLFNHRHFHLWLDGQLERGRRYGESLSLLMLDIDHFKEVNDLHGHKLGDTALKELAAAIRRVFRSIDYAARYGGDEFVVALPATGAEAAIAAAERLRREVAAIELRDPVNHERVRLTISCGVADFPVGAEERDGLINKADAALRNAKRHGRDLVMYQEPSKSA